MCSQIWVYKNIKAKIQRTFWYIAKDGDLDYKLALSPNLDGVHNIYHVSMLKKYVRDKNHIIPNYTELDIHPNTTYVEKSLKILDRQDKILMTKTVPLVKVLWSNQGKKRLGKCKMISGKSINCLKNNLR